VAAAAPLPAKTPTVTLPEKFVTGFPDASTATTFTAGLIS
jgi:hypothetical protein